MTEAKFDVNSSSGVDMETVTAFREQANYSGADSRPYPNRNSIIDRTATVDEDGTDVSVNRYDNS